VPTILFKTETLRPLQASLPKFSTKAVLGRCLQASHWRLGLRSQLPYFVARIQVSLRVLVHGTTWLSRTIK
jgi:hypothetical protein